jgi:tripartite-type tricarboxylate transporter receptor subunit TctC
MPRTIRLNVGRNRRTFTHVLRKALCAAAAAAFALTSTGASAQAYPDKPIRFIVPMAPGGGVDVISRLVGQQLATQIGQPVIVENKPGAGGAVAAGFVARSDPDGYTIFVADTGQLSINPSLYKKLSYDADKPFVPITEAVTTPLFLAVNASLPVRSVKELVAYAKANHTSYGTTGVGSVHHLGMESFALQTGVKLIHVPYKGAAQAVVALATGEVDAAFSALPSLKPHLDSGKIRVIAVTTPNRVPLMPDVPTVAESGVPNFDVSVNIGFVLPPGTPQNLATRLHGDFIKALSAPEIRQKVAALSMVYRGSSQQQYTQQIKEDTVKYRKVIDSTGVRMD